MRFIGLKIVILPMCEGLVADDQIAEFDLRSEDLARRETAIAVRDRCGDFGVGGVGESDIRGVDPEVEASRVQLDLEWLTSDDDGSDVKTKLVSQKIDVFELVGI